MNECNMGHINNAIWWGYTGIFGGHGHSVTSLNLLSSLDLLPLLSPQAQDADVDDDGEEQKHNKRAKLGCCSCQAAQLDLSVHV